MVGLTKTFGAVTACNSISMAVEAGTVHAIVGENGAGKTTLDAVRRRPDATRLRRASGSTARPGGSSSVEAARSLGVGMVHQEFSVVDDLTLAENLVLGIEPVRRGTLDLAAIESATAGLEARTGWKLPWDRPAGDVGVADLSRFELLRQLHRGSDLLILDEPTAVLGPADVDQLLATMAELRDAGRTIVFITHKLGEVHARGRRRHRPQGRRGGVVRSGGGHQRHHARPGDGRGLAVEALTVDETAATGEVILETSGLTVVDERGALRLDHVDLTVAGGEVVAVYGVAGSGQRPLVEAIIGLTPADGTVRLAGVDITDRPPAERRRAGISYISPDRRHEGLALGESVLANVVAGQQRRPQFSRRGVIVADAWRQTVRPCRQALPSRCGRPGDARRNAVGRQPATARRRARARSGLRRSSSPPTPRGGSTSKG